VAIAPTEATGGVTEMSIKLYLTGNLRNLTKGKKDLFEVNGKTVGECLDHLVSLAPAMKRALFYESGDALYDNVKVLVNRKGVDQEGLEKKINDGDVIYIALMSLKRCAEAGS